MKTLSFYLSKLFYILILTVMCCVCINTPCHAQLKVDPPMAMPAYPPSLNPLAKPINSLGFNLFKEIINNESFDTNIAISPVSISTALTMTFMSADGETKEAMQKVLEFNNNYGENIYVLFRQLNKYLKSLDQDVTFSTANSIWIDSGFGLSDSYRQQCESFFDSKVSQCEFSDPTSVDIVNDWIEENTNGRISDIIDEIPSSALMYLVNTVYFNASWKYPFNPEWTHQAPFTLEDGTIIKCSMMSQKRLNLPYVEINDFGIKAVELSYGDSSFAMTIILPDEGHAVTDIINNLTTSKWDEILTSMKTTSIDVSLPSFKIKSDHNLKKALCALGMGIAFEPYQADFSRMNKYNSKNMFMDRVIHGAFIDVTETGTEAGAATVVEIKKRYLVKSLLIDRPFIFAIRDVTSGTILFLGKVVNPELL